MGRLQQVIRSVFSGYAFLIANAFYTFVSVRLALNYMGTIEFGVWVIAAQLALVLTLLDYGLTPTVTRLLIDSVNRRDSTPIATAIKSCAMVQLAEGLLIALLGLGAGSVAARFCRIDPAYHHDFTRVVICLCFVQGATLAVKILVQILTAYQRLHVVNYSYVAGFFLGFVTLLTGLKLGHGIFSLVEANAVFLLISAGIQWRMCQRLGLLPAGTWRLPHSAAFLKEVFHLSRDTFFLGVCSFVTINMHALILASAVSAAESAAWSVASRLYVFMSLVLYRLFDSALPTLSEMMANGEKDRLRNRFTAITLLSGCTGMVFACVLIACNRDLLFVWTDDQIQWTRLNDCLFALWIPLRALYHPHIMFLIASKDLRVFRWVYFFELLVFLPAAYLLSRYYQSTGILVASIVTTTLFDGVYSIRRAACLVGMPVRTLMRRWLRPMAWTGLVTGLVTAGVVCIASRWSPWLRLAGSGGIIGLTGVFCLYAFALDDEMKTRLRLHLRQGRVRNLRGV